MVHHSLDQIVLRCSTMEEIGVRELRQHASRWLARVQAGETFVVTDRGRPVARLGPLEEPATGLAALLDQGRAVPGTGGLLELDPLPADRGGPSLGEILDEQRTDER